MIRCIGIDQATVMLMDHLSGAMSHLIGQPLDGDCATGEQLAGIGMPTIIGSPILDPTSRQMRSPTILDLIVVVVGTSAFAVPQPVQLFFFVGAVVTVEDLDGLKWSVFDQLDLLL